MGLIKGKSGIQKLLVGYPTMSDKYDVMPATLSGADVVNGDVVMFIMLDSGLGLSAQSYVDAFTALCGGKVDFSI